MVAFVRRLRIFVAHLATHVTALLPKIDSWLSAGRGVILLGSEHGSVYYSKKKKMIFVFENIFLILLEDVTKQYYILFGVQN